MSAGRLPGLKKPIHTHVRRSAALSLCDSLTGETMEITKVSYTIGYGNRDKPDVSIAQRNTAQEALELAEALQKSDEEIKFIDTPTEGRVGMDMLRVLAKEEAGEA